jgi:O-acetyl-ADP-ribose deacetylase (regulator of RNase III)
MMRLVLRDLDSDVVLALSEAFGPVAGTNVGVGNLLTAGVDAVVVPIQGVDLLDGGFARDCRAAFGTRAWAHLRVVTDNKYGGTIPVGGAVMVSTGRAGCRWMIAAPARHHAQWVGRARVHKDDHGRVINPGFRQDLFPAVKARLSSMSALRGGVGLEQAAGTPAAARQPAEGAYMALHAALRLAQDQADIQDLGVPGLGTGAAGGDPFACANAMRRAWGEWCGSQ